MPDRASEIKINPWATRAPELARWAWDRYVIRDDVWGGYNAIADREKVIQRPDGTTYKLGPTRTCPAKPKRGIVKLTPGIVAAHFRADRPEQVIGAHTTSPDNHSKFGTIETDWHSPDSTAPEVNERAAKGWYQALRERRFRPLLWDSNRAGGFHLDTLFASPVPTPRLFWFLRELVSNHAAYGLPTRPETFPKQSELRPKPDGRGRYGNWVRLPGRHHTREVWARVWDGSEWTQGERAIDYLLSLQGDDPALVPEHDDIAYRARAYLAQVPHGREGTGRDDRAFNAAAFLVRDMGLSDADALRFLEEWDAGNSPPKGRVRLQEIIANAHSYGANGYGSGLHKSAPVSTAPPSTPQRESVVRRPASDIIREYLAGYYVPTFRRAERIWSSTIGREVRRSEAISGAQTQLVDALANAIEVKRGEDGQAVRSTIPKVYRDWAPTAWADLLASLDEEAETAEIVELAAEQFRALVAVGLNTLVQLTEPLKDHEEKTIQRRSLIEWCRLFAKDGRWKSIRSFLIWCRRDANKQLQVAVRVGLFAPGQAYQRQLAEMSHYEFSEKCKLYGVGSPESDGQRARAGGQAVVVLSPEYVRERFSEPVDPGLDS